MARMAAPEDESLDGLFAAMSLMDYQIGSHFYARATHLIDPHNFYVIPIKYLDHLPALNKAREPCRVEELQESQTVIYRSLALNRDIRGSIQRIDNQKCRIYALDHGFLEGNVSVERIFHPFNEETVTTPSLVHHCELDMCCPMGDRFSDDAIEGFKFFMGNERLKIFIRGKVGEKLRVLVYNSNPDDVSTLLALTHYTYLYGRIADINVEDNAGVVIPPPVTYKHRKVIKGETIKVRVQSGTNLDDFYVTPLTAYKDYLENRSEFNAYCKSLAQITLADFLPGAAVGVREDHSKPYERAVILEIIEPNAKAKVKLVDWGYDIVVPIDRIKAVKTAFYAVFPMHALYCAAVQGFKPWNNGLPVFLYKGYNFEITVQRVGIGFEEPHVVSISPIST